MKGAVKVTAVGGITGRGLWLHRAYASGQFSSQMNTHTPIFFLLSFTRLRLRSLVVIIALWGGLILPSWHPSVAIQGIWHQLSFTCSSKLQWKVTVLLCDTSVDRLVSEELPIPTFPLAFPPQLWELVHKKRERERNPPVMSRIMNV